MGAKEKLRGMMMAENIKNSRFNRALSERKFFSDENYRDRSFAETKRRNLAHEKNIDEDQAFRQDVNLQKIKSQDRALDQQKDLSDRNFFANKVERARLHELSTIKASNEYHVKMNSMEMAGFTAKEKKKKAIADIKMNNARIDATKNSLNSQIELTKNELRTAEKNKEKYGSTQKNEAILNRYKKELIKLNENLAINETKRKAIRGAK